MAFVWLGRKFSNGYLRFVGFKISLEDTIGKLCLSRWCAHAPWCSASLGRRSCVSVRTRRAWLVAWRPADGGQRISERVTRSEAWCLSGRLDARPCPLLTSAERSEHHSGTDGTILVWIACLYTTLPSWVRRRSSPNNPRLSSRRWSSVSDKIRVRAIISTRAAFSTPFLRSTPRRKEALAEPRRLFRRRAFLRP